MAESSLRAGLHLHGTEFDLESALALGLRSYTLLDLDRELVPHILRRYPDARIHIRQWAFVTDDPHSRAEEASRYIAELLRQWPQADLWFSSANEPDIESFGGRMTEERFLTWAAYASRWAIQLHSHPDILQERLRLLYCAPSPGHQEDGPESPIGYQIMRSAIEALYEGLAVHSYIDPPDQDRELQWWLRYRIFRPAGHKHPGDPGGIYQLTRDWRTRHGRPFPLWVSECNVTDARAASAAKRAAEFIQRVAELDVDRRIL